MTGEAYASAVDATNIENFTIGPPNNDFGIPQYRFKIFTGLSEVGFSLRFEQIQYGDKSRRLKVVNSFTVDHKLIRGGAPFNSVSDLNWVSYNSFRIAGDPALYTIKTNGNKFTVIRKLKF